MVFRIGRLGPRSFLMFTSAGILFVTFVFLLTPIISPLPPYTGPYEVGILDVETEVQKRVVHDAVLKATGDKAFELNTLAITLYYPSSLPREPPSQRPWARPWLPQPVSLIGEGYARLAGVPKLSSLFTFALWAFGSSTVIPGVVDAPILSGAQHVLGSGVDDFEKMMNVAEQEHMELKRDSNTGTLPCMVFTHGMAGMSQSYAHYLGSIASHGYVVAAVEHRDGSGPGTIIHHPNGRDEKVWHMKLEDLEANPPMTELDLKAAQLNYREAEISETIKLFAQLNAGDAPVVNLKPDSPRNALPGFKNRLNLSAVTVGGHSYGATGAMQALKSAGTKEMPINGGIALDPGKGSGPLNKDIDVPILVMQSGEWTEKQTQFYDQGWHFNVVKKIIDSVNQGWFMTLSGTAHPSCTDAPLIVPMIMKLVSGTTLNSRTALHEYIDASVAFLEYLRTGEKKGVLASGVTNAQGPFLKDGEREKVKGSQGADWEVHVVPDEE
ncbi:uncharacterized protein yc1106_05902 [Curvularia clavata]|uniref:Putative phospholipase n=1 Tax=Curvularia clavata TaxID=95742 RepID=A0A9Q8ZDA5_CURCL|nr:uncharacterized protein yc1106_05902 [Curvularia clavata]